MVLTCKDKVTSQNVKGFPAREELFSPFFFLPLNASCVSRVYFKLGNDLSAGCKIAINFNAACHLSKMKYFSKGFVNGDDRST